MGMLLGVLVLPANFSDDYGAKALLRQIAFVTRWLLIIFDGGYDKPPLIDWCQNMFGVAVQISRRIAEQGFVVIPKRWIVERTFAWLGKFRRLSKDYELLPKNSESFIYLAMIKIMVRRLSIL